MSSELVPNAVLGIPETATPEERAAAIEAAKRALGIGATTDTDTFESINAVDIDHRLSAVSHSEDMAKKHGSGKRALQALREIPDVFEDD